MPLPLTWGSYVNLEHFDNLKFLVTDNEIENILYSKELLEIETSIASQCKTYVNKEFVEFTIGILRREISNSGLTLDYIRQLLSLRKGSIIRFGIQLLNNLKGKPIEEEYPKGERVPKTNKPEIISSQGVGIGFGIKYAIYLDYLENRPKDLINYLTKERIPKANKFSKILGKLYSV